MMGQCINAHVFSFVMLWLKLITSWKVLIPACLTTYKGLVKGSI